MEHDPELKEFLRVTNSRLTLNRLLDTINPHDPALAANIATFGYAGSNMLPHDCSRGPYKIYIYDYLILPTFWALQPTNIAYGVINTLRYMNTYTLYYSGPGAPERKTGNATTEDVALFFLEDLTDGNYEHILKMTRLVEAQIGSAQPILIINQWKSTRSIHEFRPSCPINVAKINEYRTTKDWLQPHIKIVKDIYGFPDRKDF